MRSWRLSPPGVNQCCSNPHPLIGSPSERIGDRVIPALRAPDRDRVSPGPGPAGPRCIHSLTSRVSQTLSQAGCPARLKWICDEREEDTLSLVKDPPTASSPNRNLNPLQARQVLSHDRCTSLCRHFPRSQSCYCLSSCNIPHYPYWH